MIRPEEAWSRIADFALPLPGERAAVALAADRRLASPVVATTDLPPLDVSALDGFALAGRTDPARPVPVDFTLRAGEPAERRLEAGRAAAIMTGAPIPDGADRVVAIEETTRIAPGVRIDRPPEQGAAIRRRGEVVRAGEILLEAGARLRPAALSLLASQGLGEVDLVRRPTVALLATGDEVVPPTDTPGRAQVRDSHTTFLTAACLRERAEPASLGIAPDRSEMIRSRLEAGAEFADLLIVCGGVSRGEFDLVEPVAVALGYRFLFDAVAIQPGKPLAVAERKGKLLFGLPGNPASAIVTFELFVAPLLRRLGGDREASFWRGALPAEVDGPVVGRRSRDRFLPASTRHEDGSWTARPLEQKGSHDLVAYARAEALLRVPFGEAEAGSSPRRLEFLPLQPV